MVLVGWDQQSSPRFVRLNLRAVAAVNAMPMAMSLEDLTASRGSDRLLRARVKLAWKGLRTGPSG